MAGGGVKRGYVHGETDDFGYNIVRDPVHVHDLHATLLQAPRRRSQAPDIFRHEGRDYRLTDIAGNVVNGLLG